MPMKKNIYKCVQKLKNSTATSQARGKLRRPPPPYFCRVHSSFPTSPAEPGQAVCWRGKLVVSVSSVLYNAAIEICFDSKVRHREEKTKLQISSSINKLVYGSFGCFNIRGRNSTDDRVWRKVALGPFSTIFGTFSEVGFGLFGFLWQQSSNNWVSHYTHCSSHTDSILYVCNHEEVRCLVDMSPQLLCESGDLLCRVFHSLYDEPDIQHFEVTNGVQWIGLCRIVTGRFYKNSCTYCFFNDLFVARLGCLKIGQNRILEPNK